MLQEVCVYRVKYELELGRAQRQRGESRWSAAASVNTRVGFSAEPHWNTSAILATWTLTAHHVWTTLSCVLG